jgi:hypothetical protein
MSECAFEQRPDIKWRKDYAKGATWSRKHHPARVSQSWYRARGHSKLKLVFAHEFLHKSRICYTSLVEREFSRLAADWKEDTRHWSSVTKMLAHPNYLRIIGLATRSRQEVQRLLLRELRNEPDHWFAALTAITGENPVSRDADFDQAVNSWLQWGRERGVA